jgi:TRAP-type C4-dicarboxylate transport system permease small subunit
MLDNLVNFGSRLSRWLVWIGGVLLIGSALLVTTEVVVRKLFNTSIGGADEISGYAFAIATSLAFSFALFERAHIRVDALYGLFPRGMQLFVDLLGLVLLTGFAAVVAWMAWQMVADTITHGSRSITPMRTPLILPQLPWLIGWLLFVAFGVLVFVAAIARWLRGDRAGASRLVGIKSIAEQIEDEVA